jgi:hypothetical protein
VSSPLGEKVRELLDGVAYIELAPPVLARALEPAGAQALRIPIRRL